jgi:hypothetical protein
MTKKPVFALLLRPPAIAIHNDGNMPRQILHVDLLL